MSLTNSGVVLRTRGLMQSVDRSGTGNLNGAFSTNDDAGIYLIVQEFPEYAGHGNLTVKVTGPSGFSGTINEGGDIMAAFPLSETVDLATVTAGPLNGENVRFLRIGAELSANGTYNVKLSVSGAIENALVGVSHQGGYSAWHFNGNGRAEAEIQLVKA